MASLNLQGCTYMKKEKTCRSLTPLTYLASNAVFWNRIREGVGDTPVPHLLDHQKKGTGWNLHELHRLCVRFRSYLFEVWIVGEIGGMYSLTCRLAVQMPLQRVRSRVRLAASQTGM